jgi:hypothetical protein
MMAALGALTKFASVALVPLLWLHDRRPRQLVAFALAGAGIALLAMLPIFWSDESLRLMYDRTVGYQAGRESPFSIWGRYDLDGLQTVWRVLSLILAIAVAVVPRRRDLVGLAALSAAILIALQLGVSHWFYLYIVWFFPLLMAAVVGGYRVGPPPTRR